jgi:glycosidase
MLIFGPWAGCAAEPPVVTKVEPPSWWVAHSHNPVRLLVSGQHLHESTLETPEGFTVANLQVSANGNYLFADLEIPRDADPGPVPLQIVNDAGATPVDFVLMRPLAREGRFQSFSPDDVIYLIMTDRFANGDPSNDRPHGSGDMLDRQKPRHYHGGDLRGVIDRLDYLEALGVTAIWLTPWYDNANELNHIEKYTLENELSPDGVPSTDYHGYGAVDFYAVEEHFGDLELLLEFVSEAQARGMKVIQDQVANHTGPLHPWVRNPPTPTWYNGSLTNHIANSWQIWTTTVPDPPADELKSTLDGWFLDILPDLNQSDPEVATYLIQNSLWWVGLTGLDAVRQDTMPYVPRQYWSQWTAALEREYPGFVVLGEVLDGDPKAVSFYQGGRGRFDGIDSGVDTLFDFPLFYAVRDVFAREQSMTRLTDLLEADTHYVDPSVLVTLLGLHDKPRFLSEDGASIEGLKLAFTFLLTTRGTPLIYYGDEIGINGGRDPHNRKDFPGGWPEDPASAFEASGRTEIQSGVHDHVCQLLTLRKELEPLRRGALVNLSVDEDTYAYARTLRDAFVVVAINNSAQSKALEIPVSGLQPGAVATMTDRLQGLGSPVVVDDRLTITLDPKSAALLTPGPALATARPASEYAPEENRGRGSASSP